MEGATPTEPSETSEPVSPITAGSLLSSTFSEWTSGLPRWTTISVLLNAPVAAVAWLVLGDRPTQSSTLGWGFLELTLGNAASMLVAAAVVHGVVESRRGRPASVGASLGTAFSCFGSILGLSVLVSLICTLWILPLLVPLVVYTTAQAMSERAAEAQKAGR